MPHDECVRCPLLMREHSEALLAPLGRPAQIRKCAGIHEETLPPMVIADRYHASGASAQSRECKPHGEAHSPSANIVSRRARRVAKLKRRSRRHCLTDRFQYVRLRALIKFREDTLIGHERSGVEVRAVLHACVVIAERYYS